jgi:serine/threonine-protein kinase
VSAVEDAANQSQGTRYRVLILGPFALERAGIRIDTGRWQSRVQQLFKLLITAPDRQRRREELIDLLWPDGDPAAVAGNLRILVHRLRLTLGGEPSPVLSGGGWISLNPAYGWELDLEQMEELAGEADGDGSRLESAVALYRGEPLIEDRYEAWAAPLLARAQRVWRDAVLQLAGIHRARGQYAAAAIWFDRLLEVDPLDEEAMQGVLAMLSHSGQPTEALRRYQNFKEYLRAELDATPASETQRLIDTIKQQLGAEPSSVESLPERPLPIGGFLGALPEGPLVDRRDELERALSASDAARAGAGSVLVLLGEAGIGKTRLAQEIMVRLREASFLVLTTDCYERERAVPFAPFLDLLALMFAAAPPAVRIDVGHRWPQLAWLLPEGAVPVREDEVTEEPDEQRALFRACSGFLGTMARERPLALMLDDLQWANESNLDLLYFLARETRSLRVLFLISYRDADISREHPLAKVVRDLSREGLAERIALGRLGPDETAVLVANTFENVSVPTEFHEFVYRRTKGNPFFIKKLVEALGGHYRLVRQIAAGGMGRVFEAVDTLTGQHVAAKLMFARSEADPKAFLRFQQESHVLAALDHPNIVRVVGAFAEEHASCIIMELVEGNSVADVIEREPLTLGRIKHMAMQVTAALAGAHERGIVHRDIKPDNIMLADGDQVKVTDFGIARLMRPLGETTLTATGMAMGTPLYMSPEQIQAGEIDNRTDIYSLGAVLYRLVTGRPPFAGDDPVSIAYKHVHELPIPPRVLRPELPEAWESAILRALAKDPNERYQTAVAMERALAELPEEADARKQAPLVSVAPGRYPDVVDVTPRIASRGRSRRTVWRAVPAVVLLVAALLLAIRALGVGASGSGADLLSGPTGIALDGRGFLYVVDADNNRVREFSPAGESVGSLGSSGNGILQFSTPSDIVIRPPDRLYVSDAGNKRILVIQDGREVNDMQFDVGSLGLDRHGNVYGTDYGHAQIRVFHGEGPDFTSIVIPEINVSSFSFPAGIVVGSADQIYIADRLHNGVAVLSASGGEQLFLGRKDRQTGTAPGEFNTPSDVALDRQGNVYVADTYNNRVQRLSPSGEPRAVWGSTKRRHFDLPTSIAVDAHGNVYVSEHFDNLVMKLSPAGQLIWSSDGEHLRRDG